MLGSPIVALGLEPPSFAWRGLSKLTNQAFDAPLWFVLVLAGMAATFFFTWSDDKLISEELRTARGKADRPPQDQA